jgi:hypothetical protein
MSNHNNGYMPPTEDGGDVVPSAAADASSFDPTTQTPQPNRMTMAIQQQDSMIDQLAVGLGRLRDQSYAIGDEAGLHTQLLDDMENNLDNAHEVLGVEARRAAQLREDGSIWKLQLIVAGLSISFVFLVLLGHL